MGDKNTLLAFLFIGLIFLLMPYYYEWMGLNPHAAEEGYENKQEYVRERETKRVDNVLETQENPRNATSENIQDQETTSTHQNKVSQPESEIIKQVFIPQKISVQTPLQELEFTTEGGVLTSVKLPKYEKLPGEKVSLLPPNGTGLILELRDENGKQGKDLRTIEFTPNTRSLNLQSGTQGTLQLRAILGDGQYIEKRFHFDADRYGVRIELAYSGFDDQTIAFLGWEGGIAFAEQNDQVDLDAMRAIAFFNEDVKELIANEAEPEEWTELGALHWAGVKNKYFFSAIIPRVPVRHHVELNSRYRYPTLGDRRPSPAHDYRVGWRLSRSGTWEGLMYLGPLDYEEVIKYQAELERAMDLGWPIVREFSKVLIVLFVAAYEYVPNYGWVIILFAFFIKLITWPLTKKSYESATKMQELAPQIAALKEKYKNDKQRLSQETMKLYSKGGANPFGSCWPMLLQMPIFVAMYSIFSSTIELRQSPFILWIDDLSRPDEIMVGGIAIHILPILMSAAMFFQTKMTMKDPKQAAMVYLMPAIMLIFMWGFASGLVLYWTVFNVLQVAQQHFNNRGKQNKVFDHSSGAHP